MNEQKQQPNIKDRPLFWNITAFIGGIILGLLCSLPLWAAFVILTIASLMLCFAFRKKQYWLLLCLSFAIGILSASWSEAAYQPFPAASEDIVIITGKVTYTSLDNTGLDNTGLNKEDNSGVFYLAPQTVDGLDYHYGELKVFCKAIELPLLGESVIVCGTVMAEIKNNNFLSFDHTAYLKQNGIVACISTAFEGSVNVTATNSNPLYKAITALRNKMNEQISRLEPQTAALVRGIFLGDKSDLNYDQQEYLVQAGIFHAFAVSGLHVGFVMMFSMLIFGFVHKRRLLFFLCNAAVLLFYGCFMNFTPSVSRAVIMALVGLFAYLFREKKDALTALAIAAACCLIYQPLLIFNAGFLLSFVTVFFILWLGESMTDIFSCMGRLAPTIAITCAASLGAMPLVAYYFYTVSSIGLLISPLIVLLVGWCVIWGLCSMLLISFLPAVSLAFVYTAGALMQFIAVICTKLTALEGSYFIIGQLKLPFILLFYALLLYIPRLLHKTGKLFTALCCLLLAMLLPLSAMHMRGEEVLTGDVLEVNFLDVGQGDCTLIIAPDGKTVLIDGGGHGTEGSVGEYILLPYLKSRGIDKIDLIINTHPDFDHTDGLITVLENLPVGYCMVTGARDIDNSRIEKAAQANETVMLYGISGNVVTLCPEITIDILFPTADFAGDNENEASLICRLNYNDISFLFTGDTEAEGIDFIIDMELAATVVKVPHHGSKYNFMEEFYDGLAPSFAVISTGDNNSYGHPHKAVTSYLAECGIITYRTDRNGEINFLTNGRELIVQTNK